MNTELDDGDLLVLKALSHGLTQSETAAAIGYSFEAVKSRLKKSRRALRAKTSAHAVANAMRKGLIP